MEPRVHLRNCLLTFITLAFASLIVYFSGNVHMYWFLYAVPLLIAAGAYGIYGTLAVGGVSVGLIAYWVLQGLYPGTIAQSPVNLKDEILLGMGTFLVAAFILGYLSDKGRKQRTMLERLSIHDSLTGLHNYGYFTGTLRDEIKRAERYETPLSFIMMDIDYFKEYNDIFGHEKGNKVLKRIAQVLVKGVREIDTVARYGGEEFAIVLPSVGKKEAVLVAERLREKVATLEFEGDKDHPVVKRTISAGVASYPRDAKSDTELIVVADHALYLAKREGRNRVCGYEAAKQA